VMGAQIGVTTTQRRERVGLPPRRSRLFPILAAGLAVLGVGGLIFVAVQRFRPAAQEPDRPATPPVAEAKTGASGRPTALPPPTKPVPIPPALQPPETSSPKPPGTEKPPTTAPVKPSANAEQPLQVVTNPPGASVMIDRDPAKTCQSPCAFQVAPGRHVLALTLAGYREELRIVEVSRQPLEQFVNMTRMMGTVLVMADVLGAQILIDGKPVPEKTPARLSLPVGKYTVSVLKDGHRADQAIEVKDGSLLKFTMQVNP